MHRAEKLLVINNTRGNKEMKAHIEYDDFGEYIEVLDDQDTALAETGMVQGMTLFVNNQGRTQNFHFHI